MKDCGKLNKKLLRNIVFLYLIQIFNQFFPIFTIPLLISGLGMDNYGIFQFGLTVSNIAFLVGDYGFSYSATKAIAKKGSNDSCKEIYYTVQTCRIFLILVVYLFIAIYFYFSNRYLVYERTALLFFLYSISNVAMPIWFFQGKDRVDVSSIISIICKLFLLVAIYLISKYIVKVRRNDVNSDGKDKLLKIINSNIQAGYEEYTQSYCVANLLSMRKQNKVVLYYPNEEPLWKEISVNYLINKGIEISNIVTIGYYCCIEILIKSISSGEISFVVLGGDHETECYRAKRFFIERFVRNICPMRLPFYHENIVLKNYREMKNVINNIDKYAKTYDMLYDFESKDTFLEVIRAKSGNDQFRLFQHPMEMKYWEGYKHLEDEVICSIGGSRGDTIIKFLLTNYEFKNLYCFEGDKKKYKVLERNINMLPDKHKEKIKLVCSYIDGVKSGEILDKHHFTLYNMDIEGAEPHVLESLKHVIDRDRPVIAACAYHNITDLVTIPQIINDATQGYYFILRKYWGPFIESLSEYIYYAIPEERIEI